MPLVMLIWFLTLIVSLLFPPLLLVTGIPLWLVARGVYGAIRREHERKAAYKAWATQELYYAEARKTAAWLR